MTWFKVDDAFAFHAKAIAAGNAALGLWVRAGSWCSANLTEGALPRHMIGTLGAQKRDAMRLVAVGLWCETETGYEFRDWHHYQPTKAQVEADREKNRVRQQAWRDRRRNAVTDSVTNDGSDDVTNGTPTRPDPSTSSKEEVDPSFEPTQELREDVEAVCQHLLERLLGHGRKGVSVTAAWRKSARLMLDRDERPIDEVHALIDWCQDSEFWRPNIGGMPKFREQYDKLRLQAQVRGQLAPAGELDRQTVQNILGPDHWVCPRPPLDLSPVEELEWEQRVRREHLAERQAQARARMGRAS